MTPEQEAAARKMAALIKDSTETTNPSLSVEEETLAMIGAMATNPNEYQAYCEQLRDLAITVLGL